MARIDPQDIADWFISRFDDDDAGLSHLKLQKLIYYAQAWSLALNETPLFDEDFEAWAHGPVVPSLWMDFREFGWNDLPVPKSCPEFDEDTENLLEDVYGAYGEYSAKRLEAMTHREDPWLKARGGLQAEEKSNKKISKSTLRRYYTNLLKE
jgi:uncharacterized phage-associated protein